MGEVQGGSGGPGYFLPTNSMFIRGLGLGNHPFCDISLQPSSSQGALWGICTGVHMSCDFVEW